MPDARDRLLAQKARLDNWLAQRTADDDRSPSCCPSCYDELVPDGLSDRGFCTTCRRDVTPITLAAAIVALQDALRFVQSASGEQCRRSPVVLDTDATYHTGYQWHRCSRCGWTWICGEHHAHGHPGCEALSAKSAAETPSANQEGTSRRVEPLAGI